MTSGSLQKMPVNFRSIQRNRAASPPAPLAALFWVCLWFFPDIFTLPRACDINLAIFHSSLSIELAYLDFFRYAVMLSLQCIWLDLGLLNLQSTQPFIFLDLFWYFAICSQFTSQYGWLRFRKIDLQSLPARYENKKTQKSSNFCQNKGSKDIFVREIYHFCCFYYNCTLYKCPV